MTDTKRHKPNPTMSGVVSTPLKICVHSGSFHADEALGYYLLKLLPKYKNSILIRSRDPVKWEESDIVIDVGGKYDGVKFFDHHQRGFNETFNENFKTKLSSAGLVYKHFGKDIIKHVLNNNNEEDVELLYLKIYKEFIESLDANDNGIEAFDDSSIKPNFATKNITLPSIIANFNPSWNEDSCDDTYYKQFLLASDFIGGCFYRMLISLGKGWLPAKQIVKDVVKQRFSFDKSGKILIFEQFVPWKSHLYEIEKELGIENEILYVLFEDSSKNWRISTVPISSTSFSNRRPLPEAWRGVRDEELSKLTGVEGCVFIHAAGFIGGAKTKDAVIKLAQISLTMN